MLVTDVIAILGVIGFALSSDVTRDYGLCSQVFQMNEYCFGESHRIFPVSNNIPPARGKAGVRGPPGKDAVVDYAAIDRSINGKFSEYQEATDVRLERCEARIDNLERELIRLTHTDCGKVTNKNAIAKNETGGVFEIYTDYRKLRVFCDITTDGGRWLVFQRRMDGSVDFYRTWADYVNGFGSNVGEFWLGLEILHRLTSSATYELRVDLEDWEGNRRFAKYSTFRVGDAASGYRLTIGSYSGDAGDSMEYSNGSSFTTKDRDSDARDGENCAVMYKGAWWYKNCHGSNLNGFYFQGGVHSSFADGIEWNGWTGQYYSLKFTEMKMRIVN